jgi:hypothetical protein
LQIVGSYGGKKSFLELGGSSSYPSLPGGLMPLFSGAYPRFSHSTILITGLESLKVQKK